MGFLPPKVGPVMWDATGTYQRITSERLELHHRMRPTCLPLSIARLRQPRRRPQRGRILHTFSNLNLTNTPTHTPTDTPTYTSTPTSSATPTSAVPGGGHGSCREHSFGDRTTEPGILPPVDLTDEARIEVPPRVDVIRGEGEKLATVVVTLPDVRIDSRLFEKLRWLAVEALAAKGVRIKYEVEIRKVESKQRITRTSSRNVVTVRKLDPGRYTVLYRVTATKGKHTIRSRPSPPTSITIT